MLRHASAPHIEVGYVVRAFDPRTLGVVKTGKVVKVGHKWATVNFGLTGTARVARIDVIEVEETRA